MSRFKALQKLLGVVSDDAAKILKKIDSDKLADSFIGKPERAEYLQALDEVYGPVNVREKLTGNTIDTLHGTTYEKPIQSFKSSKAKSGQLYGRGTYSTKNPEEAELYTQILDPHSGIPLEEVSGSIYPLKIRAEKIFDVDNVDPADLKLIKKDLGIKENIHPRYLATREGITPEIFTKTLKKYGYDTVKDGDIYNTLNPSQIRSKFAAFDPRFKNSKLLMAGAGAIPQANINPMEALKGIKENIAEPVVERYNKLKSYLTGPLAKQMNLSKNPEVEKGLKQGLDMGLDPVNLIPGGAGVGAGLLQLLGEKDEEE